MLLRCIAEKVFVQQHIGHIWIGCINQHGQVLRIVAD